MPFNGSGTFSRYTPGTPYVNGTTIDETVVNSEMSDVATGLTNCVTRDGQSPATANLPMGGFRHTGVGNSTTRAAATYASAADVQDGTLAGLTASAGTNTITATAGISLTAYATNQIFTLNPANTNTGATTLNLNSIGAKNVFCAGRACIGGELKQSFPVLVQYDGTQFNIIGDIDINALTADATPDQDADYVMSYDASATAFKKVLVKNLKQSGPLINSLGGNVALNNTGSYFTGPTVAQGTTGTWFFSGTVTVTDTAGAATINVKLTDGTTVIATAASRVAAANVPVSISISGYLASPAASVSIQVNDSTSTSGSILSNSTGNNKDSTLTAFRIG